MKKQTIISIIIVLLTLGACSTQPSKSSSALPMWERKSAPAVILGRYVGWKPGDDCNPPGFWGNGESLKGNNIPDIIVDSTAGRFTIVWDICYPLKFDFHGWSLMLLPGDTIKLEFDRAAFAEYEAYTRPPAESVTTQKMQELWKKAIHIEGGTFEQLKPLHMKGMRLGVSRDYAKTHAQDTFDQWREVCWEEFQDVVKQLDSLDLSLGEREYRRMLIEQDYLNKLRNFMFVKKSWKFITDKDSLEMFEKQFTFKDPHATELTYYRNITGFYACLSNMFGEGKEYIEANGLGDSPLGRWFRELDEAKAVMVMAGTNNGNPAADVARGIRRLVEVICERQPKAKVLLLPVFPRGEKPDNSTRVKYEKVKEMIRGLADGKRIIWCDFNDRLLEPDGTATKEVFTDFCHLTEKGYGIWREAMLPHFREACEK